MAIAVLGIAGGTRRNGNSESLLDQALLGARDTGATTEKVVLLDLAISPCICPQSEDCLPTGICTVLDDMQGLYSMLRSVDLVFIAFPIAFRSVPAQTKALLDRTQALWARKFVLGRQVREAPGKGHGLIIGVADRDDPKEFEGAILAVRSWFISFHFQEAARLLYPNMARMDDSVNRPDALLESYETGARLTREALARGQ